MKALILSTAFLFTGFVHADKAADSPACAKIAQACETAGFKPGDHKKTGKGLWVDCVGAIAKGKTVAGVSITADEAKTCLASHKDMKAEHMMNKAAKGMVPPAAPTTPAMPTETK